MTFQSIKAILDAHGYNALIGLQEDAWLEAKGSTPYNLDSAEGRYELAKDVSAFANNSGGVIIIGLTTIPSADVQTDQITAFDLCPAANFVPHRYRSLIEEYIHPVIEGLAVYWSPVSEDGTAGLGVIEIPPQNPDRQYFLIANVVERGAKMKQIVFGVARRNDAANDPLTREQLYRHMQYGKSSLAQMLNKIDEKLEAIMVNQSRAIEPVDPEAIYAARAADILDEAGE